MHSKRITLAFSLLSAALAAQTAPLGETASTTVPGATAPKSGGIVGPLAGAAVPASLANAFGNSNNNIPFSWSPTQYQQVFLGSELPTAYVMKGLNLRQDDAFSGFAGKTVDL